MITRLLAIGIFGMLTCTVFASDAGGDGLATASNVELLFADNNRKDRRDDRQDDRDDKQDCRQEEGRVGNDKRECKHEDDDDAEGDEEPEGDAADA